MAPIRLRLLGTPVVEVGADVAPFPASVPGSLLAYLAVAGDWVARPELAYLYRPDEPETAALQYLRLQVHRAQRFPWASGMEVDAQRVRWVVDSDVAVFRAACREGAWAAAIDAYRGPLLAGVALRDRATFGTWLDLERADLEQRYRTALERRVADLAATGAHDEAAAVAERILDLDAFDEGGLRLVLRALLAGGHRDEARRRYERFAQALHDELGVAPAAATQELLSQPEPPSAVGGRSGVGRRDPLPRPATRFVGRSRELQDLTRLLQDPSCRLVTVVGLGGSGKTRLALEAARAAAASFAEGAAFVSGADAATVPQLLELVADALGVGIDGPRDAADALADALAEHEVLLVLDNLEHLPAAAPWVAGLLERAPGVRVLATARVPLGVHAEWTYDLGGLALPEGDATAGEAVELFVGAARRVAPRLALDDDDLRHVARLCRRLDGLPLAVELAATWVRAMPVRAIADALEADLGLLTTDRVDVPERHRSVTDVLERTWDDLSPAKRDALLRLVPFVGGCSLAAAEDVTGAPATLWLSLLNGSLLQRRAADRFAAHPLVADHAAAELRRRPELEVEVRDAHADHFVARLEAAGRPGGPGLRSLDADGADLERAWDRLLERGDAAAAARFARPFFDRYDVRGAFRAGLDVAFRSLARLPEPRDADAVALRCGVLLAIATLSWEAGDFAPARGHLDEALALASEAGATLLVARAYRGLGDVQQSTGAFDEAAASYARASEAFERAGERRGLADVLNSWASMDAVRERVDEAEGRFRRAVALFDELGAANDAAIARTNLGYLAEGRGDVDEAARQYEAGLAVFEREGFARGVAAIQNNLVVLYGTQGRYVEAEAMGRASLASKAAMGDELGTVITRKNLGDLQLMQGAADEALGHLLPALRIAHARGAVPRLLQVLLSTADALGRLGDAAQAVELARIVLTHPSTPGSLVARATELVGAWVDDGRAGPDDGPTHDPADLDRVVARLLADA